MSLASRLSTLLLCLATVLMTSGCVSPMGCGTHACGPIALGDSSCEGCGQCEGCGELYLDPWINHPPDCCDPCDSCGNYNGQSCGQCRSVFGGIRTLWGYRCDDGCSSYAVADCGCDAPPTCGGPSCGGCDSCGGYDASCGIESASCGTESYALDGVVTGDDQVVRIVTTPIPAQGIIHTQPQLRPYPQGIKRIFQAREDVAEAELNSAGY